MPPRRKYNLTIPLNERIHDGRIFEANKPGNGFIYLRCQTPFCRGTAKKYPDGIVLSHGHSAICYNNEDAQTIADFKEALKTTLQRHFWKLKNLYDTVAELFPRKAKVLVPYQSILSSLKRWRRQLFPRNPKSLEEMAEQLAKPEHAHLFEYDAGRLHTQRVIDADGKIHLLIYDPELIRSEFLNLLRLFIDGTFQTTPKLRNVYQLVSILGVKYNHAIPFIHILMACKTQTAYTAVLSEVKNLINTAAVEVVMTDFEQALRNACRGVFTNALITGCNVHYDRALLKKIKSPGMTQLVNNNADAKVFLKKVMALAYLPAEMIQTEYEALKNQLTPAMKRSFARFLTYYERQWLRLVKPAGFSVFGLSRRTNNVIESYNSVLADQLGQHPSAWTFMTKLIKLTSNARDDLRSLSLCKRIKRHPRYSSIYKQTELIKAWKELYARDVTPAEFLTRAAMLKGHISQRIANIAEERPGDEPELEEPVVTDPGGDDPDYEHHIFENIRFDDNEENEDHESTQQDSDDMDTDEASGTPAESDMDTNEASGAQAENGTSSDEEENAEIGGHPPEDNLFGGNIGDAQQFGDNRNLMERRNEDGLERPTASASNSHVDLAHLARVVDDGNIAAERRNENETERPISPIEDAFNFNVSHLAEIVENGDHDGVAPPQETETIEISSSNEDSDADHEIELVEPAIASERINNEPEMPTHNRNNGDQAATEQQPRRKGSRSRLKNLRKRRRQKQKKDQDGTAVVRPYGHKRRGKKNGGICVVCKVKRVTHTFDQCGHLCCCEECLKTMMKMNMAKKCPKCRKPYEKVIHTYVE